MKSLCPWKGVASYYTVEVDGARDTNAAWTYRHPSPLARRIKNHIAFWGDVVVVRGQAGPSGPQHEDRAAVAGMTWRRRTWLTRRTAHWGHR